MRYFVTGASGWIGSATARALLADGHEVLGLARSDDAARAASAAGADVVRGSLTDLDVLRSAADDSDGVLHLGFRHDIAFTGDFAGAIASDRAAIEAFGDVLAGSDRPLVIASGTLGLAPGRVGTERDMPGLDTHPRIANAAVALALAERGVRSAVIRYAPTVHGAGDHGFVAALVDIARETRVAGFVGDGSNRWAAVHRLDAADLTARVVQHAPAGSVWHATAEDGVTTREIAEAIGRALDVPVEPRPAEHFRFLADFFASDAPASSEITRAELHWQPTRPGLIADLDAGSYTPAAASGRG